ncbi:MAG: TolC family protein [Pseudomonadota bacterium]
MYKRFFRASLGICCAMVVVRGHAADDVWTLERTVAHALAVAPELRAREAEIAMQQGEWSTAQAWPNPRLDLRFDNKLGLESGVGGVEIQQLAVTQALPWRTHAARAKQALAQVTAAQHAAHYARLQRENHVAHAFHALQYATEYLALAQARLVWAEEYAAERAKPKDDPLVRFLTPLDRARLRIMRESARQEVANAEGKYSERAASLRLLLALATEDSLRLPSLTPLADSPALTALLAALDWHVALAGGQATRDAASAALDGVRAFAYGAPSVTAYYERGYYAGDTRAVWGAALGVELPLWTTHRGAIDRAHAEVAKAGAEYAAQRRTLEGALRQNYMHLGHLIEQAEHYRNAMLAPAEEVFELTRKSFNVGEVSVLNLVDAHDTHFTARARYLELLAEARHEAADVRLAAGLTLTGVSP